MRLSLPLMLFLFCEALVAFVERIFLSYHSTDAVHASLSASYLASIFQTPCVAIAAMAQVFVGLYQGSNELKKIGPCVWQMIWFSLFSLILTLPLSFWTSEFYFKDTAIQQAGVTYFGILALGNFLFPLNTTLSSFYLGRGKTFLTTCLMLGSYGFNLLLSWVLIFGFKGVIPPMGIKGAALAKCYSLGLFTAIFFCTFLSKKNRELYGTSSWRFSLPTLWSYMHPGMVRAFAYLSSKVCWVSVSYLMIKKGGEHLDTLTIGGTVITFLTFITVGIYRAILTITSNILGAKNYQEIQKLYRSCLVYIALIAIFLSIPLLVFPHSMGYFFDSSSYALFKKTFSTVNLWIWLYIIALTIQMSFCGMIVAARDLKFQFYAYILIWITSFLPAYFIIDLKGFPASSLWLIMALENFVFALIFLWRLRRRTWTTEAVRPIS